MANVTIDDRVYEAAEGTSLMEVARSEGLPIASICYSDHLDAYGSCRLCVVQVEGQRALTAACTTPVRDGMAVKTSTPDIRRIRRTLLDLYLSEESAQYLPPHPVEPSELHDLAAEHGASHTRFSGERHVVHTATPDDTSPFPAKPITWRNNFYLAKRSNRHSCSN